MEGKGRMAIFQRKALSTEPKSPQSLFITLINIMEYFMVGQLKELGTEMVPGKVPGGTPQGPWNRTVSH